jgi:putative transposase
LIVEFIDANKADYGVEPICDVLQFAPSTYYAAKTRLPSARALSDALMKVVLLRLFIDNLSVYGARKLWMAAHRAGLDIGRDRVSRLMGDIGIQGVRRQCHVRTTRRTEGAPRAPDLVDRDFTAIAPDRLWVTDLTHVQTCAGTAYVSIICDVFSRYIVGWRVAVNMAMAMVLESLEMARTLRGDRRFVGLVCHSDAGAQYTSIRYTERLAELGALPSIGTVADCPLTGQSRGTLSACASTSIGRFNRHYPGPPGLPIFDWPDNPTTTPSPKQ